MNCRKERRKPNKHNEDLRHSLTHIARRLSRRPNKTLCLIRHLNKGVAQHRQYLYPYPTSRRLSPFQHILPLFFFLLLLFPRFCRLFLESQHGVNSTRAGGKSALTIGVFPSFSRYTVQAVFCFLPALVVFLFLLF